MIQVNQVPAKKPSSMISFANVNVGLMFEAGGDIWIKTQTCASSKKQDNAIVIGTGKSAHFEPEEPVQMVNAKVEWSLKYT